MSKCELNIFDKNLEILQSRMPALAEACRNYTDQPDKAAVEASALNEQIICIQREKRIWYLNSRYKAQWAAEQWVNAYKDAHYKGIFVLLGLSNGMYARELLSVLGDENIVILYEPDAQIFQTVAEQIDISDILSDKRLTIFVENMNMNSFRNYFEINCPWELIDLVQILLSPGYERLYMQQLQKFIDDCRKVIKMISAVQNTLRDTGEEICDNIVSNIWALLKGSSINNLKKSFIENKVEMDKVPAIIIAAGPSLDKNVDVLKQAKGNAVLIAVDSAIRKLLQHDILPDMLITVDSHKPVSLFADERIEEIPLVACGQSLSTAVQLHRGKMIAFSGDEFSLKTYYILKRHVDGLQTGGSVANNAYSLAEYLGFKNIILVGQDLAFTGDRKHASNVYKEKALNEELDEDITYVEGQDGETLMTYHNFKMYKEWFEGRIEDNPQINVINATEGGAKIYGAKQMSLQEAVDQYCQTPFDTNVIEMAENLYTEEELENVYQYICSMQERCLELEKKFEQEIQQYEKMAKLLEAGETNNLSFDQLRRDIEKDSALNEQEPIMGLLTMYARDEENEILSQIYQEDDGIEGALLAVKHSQDILAVYKKKIAHIKEQLDLLIRGDMSKDLYEVTIYEIEFA